MILHKYILRTHILPFAFSIITLMLIFLLQFLMKFADRLVGKGLDTLIVIQLIIYNLAWMVVLVVPMAVLVATLMAFGSLSQTNEITIIKSSGVSLYKMMTAPFLASIVVAYLLVLFNNDVLPDANHQAKNLMNDISRTKPTLSLEPGVFSQEVANYAILVRRIDKKTGQLSGVTIYDYTIPNKINVVTAEQGRIFFSGDQTKLIMALEQGEIHESQAGNTNLYRKLVFTRHRITMNADQFSFQQSGPGGPRGDRELSTNDMKAIIDSLSIQKARNYNSFVSEAKKFMFADTTRLFTPRGANINTPAVLYARAAERIKTIRNLTLSNYKRVEYTQGEIDKYLVEVYKKYAIPAACIIFVLIGAPLGIMVRKGGFGVAASISLFFFLIYWAFLIGGEKLADRNIISPFFGMWAANILLGIAGILMTIKMVRETVTLRFEMLKKLIPKAWRPEETEENDENN